MPLILIALLSEPATASRLTVDPEGAGDYLALSSALADAQTGDYIALAPGVHSGGVQITQPVRIIGLGATPVETELSGSSLGLDLRADVVIENVYLSGSSYGLYSYGLSGSEGRRLVLQGSSPLYAYLSSWELENVAFYGGQVRSEAATISGSQLSFVDSSLYASSSLSPVTVSGVVGNDFWATCSGSSIVMTVSYLLYSSGSLTSGCVSRSNVYAYFDTGWAHYTGEPTTDDLSLVAGSDGVDAGPAGCLDVDGSRCDLGHLGGLLGQDVDLDGDAIPDAYEVTMGLDSTVANGADDDDGDGLDNLGEYLFGTDPLLQDSDGDGVEDQEELDLGFDPGDPLDQVPNAALSAPDFGVIGELAVLDASGSSDPTSDTLSFTILVQAAPMASTLLGTELAMSGALASFVPDAVGLWTFELQVSDGVNTTSVQLEWRARSVGTDIRVPEDFLSLDDAVAVFKARDSILIGPGDYTLANPAVDSFSGLRFVGSGMDQTRIVLEGELKVQDLELQDLEWVGGENYAFFVENGEHLALSRVRVSGAQYGIYADDLDWISIEGSQISGSDASLYFSNIGTVVVARSSFEQTLQIYAAQRTLIQGVWIDGGAGLVLVDSALVQLSNLSVTAVSSAFYASNVDVLSADHIYLQDITGEHCVPGQWSHVMVRGSTTPLSGCSVFDLSSDGAGLDSSGVPLLDSLAWDGGGPFDVDPDETRRDVGWTGGPHGMRWDPEIEFPWLDSDGDGLSAMTEWVLGSDPEQADSDGDGVGDRNEVAAGQDPIDPADNVEVLSPRPLRLQGQAHSVSYRLEDPQGESCEMVWQDGVIGSEREIPAVGAPLERLGFEILCGTGRSSGELLVLREEELSVPGDYPSLLEALAAAKDHHRVLLGEGVWEVGELRLQGSEVAITGQGSTWISGQVDIDGEATSLMDLGIMGDLRTTAGGLLRVEVQGNLSSSETWMRNVLVHGDLYADAGSAANLSVLGDLFGGFSDIRSSASAGQLQLRADALGNDRIQGEAETLWVYPSEDPEEAVLLPWPGSPLWDQGSEQKALLDLDGSREDIGWTGGPQARDFDLDDDGLPDPYERWAGVSEPTDDEDQDNWDNAEEFAHGTDPLNWDTDGDRLMDSVDPYPLIASGRGLNLGLRTSDVFPQQGDWVEVRADLMDPAGRLGGVEWELLAPPESVQDMRIDGDVLQLRIDVLGSWRIRAQVDVEGEPLSAELTLYTQDPVLVPLSSSLERAIDQARPGQVLLLEGGPREVSGLVIDKDLVIRHENGSRGVVNSDLLAPILAVKGGARVRLQGITLRAGTELPAVVVSDGAIFELRQGSIIGGLQNISATNSTVDVQGSLLSLADGAVLLGVGSSFYVAHSNLGWSNDADDPGLMLDLSDSSVTLVASVPQWAGVSWTLCREKPCTVLAQASVLPDEELVFLDDSLRAEDSLYGEPGFLRAPDEELNPASADMRLSSNSPLRDVLKSVDWDGTPGDVGMYGGAWGDWLDVDNDRDGYTNLEGDCDDGDPEVVPNLLTGNCEARAGCASQGSGSAPLALILSLLAMLLRLSRTGLKAAEAQGGEID